jgi:hypothetical protein
MRVDVGHPRWQIPEGARYPRSGTEGWGTVVHAWAGQHLTGRCAGRRLRRRCWWRYRPGRRDGGRSVCHTHQGRKRRVMGLATDPVATRLLRSKARSSPNQPVRREPWLFCPPRTTATICRFSRGHTVYAGGRSQVRRCELVLAASPFRSVSCGHFLWGPSPLVRAVAEDSPFVRCAIRSPTSPRRLLRFSGPTGVARDGVIDQRTEY